MTGGLAMLAILALAGGGCGDSEGAPVDAAADGTVALVDARTNEIAPPEPPALGPCPEGWRTIEGDVVTCDPWPASGRATCGDGEAHFPGTEGCAPVGDRCPATGSFPADLPATGEIRHVRAGAPPGGDGSASAPFATIAEALALPGSAATIAVADGVYEEESLELHNRTVLIGACAERVHIRATTASLARAGVVSVYGEGVVVRNVTLSGAREGLVLRDDGASAEVRGVVVDGATAAGVSVFPGASLTGSDLVVRDVTPVDPGWGYGIAVAPTGTVSLARVVVEGATSSAVSTLGPVELSDVALVDIHAQPLDGLLGVGVEALGGAQVLLTRAVIERAHERALRVSEPGTQVTLEDAVVRDTQPRAADGGGGGAAFVFDGGMLELSRTLIAGQRDAALLVSDPMSRAVLRHTIVRGTRGRDADQGGGSALAVQDGAEAELSHVLADDNRGAAIFVASGSRATVADLSVRATGSEESDERFGAGIHVQGGADLEGERVLVAQNRGTGVAAIGPGSAVRLTDVRVSETGERECASSTCPGLGFGDGAVSAVDASIELGRFAIEGSARAGVHVAGGVMDLREGTIVRNAIGAAIQTPGFDVARISDGVIFADNGRNVDMSSLPIPEPTVEY